MAAAISTKRSERVVTHLTKTDRKRLLKIAKKHKISVGQLVRGVLTSFMYRYSIKHEDADDCIERAER